MSVANGGVVSKLLISIVFVAAVSSAALGGYALSNFLDQKGTAQPAVSTS